MTTLNTPKEDRDEAFYADQFTDATNWGPRTFENYCAEIGFVEPDPEDHFGHRALRLWEALTPEQRQDFARSLDDWLDA